MFKYPALPDDSDLIDAPHAAGLCLHHELDTFERAMAVLAQWPRITIGDTDTHGIALHLHDLVMAIEGY